MTAWQARDPVNEAIEEHCSDDAADLLAIHWDLELAARYAKFIPRHTWCIKHKSHKHTFFINLFYLRTFSKKKEFPSFWVRLALFF